MVVAFRAKGGTGLPENDSCSNGQGPAGTMDSPRGTRGLEQDYDLFMRFDMERGVGIGRWFLGANILSCLSVTSQQLREKEPFGLEGCMQQRSGREVRGNYGDRLKDMGK